MEAKAVPVPSWAEMPWLEVADSCEFFSASAALEAPPAVESEQVNYSEWPTGIKVGASEQSLTPSPGELSRWWHLAPSQLLGGKGGGGRSGGGLHSLRSYCVSVGENISTSLALSSPFYWWEKQIKLLNKLLENPLHVWLTSKTALSITHSS